MKSFWYFILLFLLLPLVSWTQIDTSLTFEEVEVVAPKIRQMPIGSESQVWGTSNLQQLPSKNMADFLTQETGVFIKSYGLGSLATSTMRGGSANHTLVLWNGLPIHSPMLGLLDLSLLPTMVSEEVQVQYGGASAMWGSGAVGGIIALNNKADASSKLKITSQSTFGSFGNFQQQVQAKIGTKRFQSHTKFSYQEADNDFFYTIHPDLPERQQTNAALLQRNWLQDFYYNINDKQKIATHFWYQQSNRQIPPSTVQNTSLARQSDRALRAVVDWQHTGKQSILNAKLGYFKEHLDYFDEQIRLESLSEFSTWIGEVDGQWALDKYQKIYFLSYYEGKT